MNYLGTVSQIGFLNHICLLLSKDKAIFTWLVLCVSKQATEYKFGGKNLIAH
jgi:hypothetical protein